MKDYKNLIKEEGNYKAFEYKGFKCRILRPHRLRGSESELIFLCGYILLPESHEFFGKDHDSIDVSVHGGLTFSSSSLFAQPEEGWWIGFDCGHAGDLCYLEESKYGYIGKEDVYRDMVYVETEIKKLVDQLPPTQLDSEESVISLIHKGESLYCRYLESLKQEPEYERSPSDVATFAIIGGLFQQERLSRSLTQRVKELERNK